MMLLRSFSFLLLAVTVLGTLAFAEEPDEDVIIDEDLVAQSDAKSANIIRSGVRRAYHHRLPSKPTLISGFTPGKVSCLPNNIFGTFFGTVFSSGN